MGELSISSTNVGCKLHNTLEQQQQLNLPNLMLAIAILPTHMLRVIGFGGRGSIFEEGDGQVAHE